LFVIEARNSKDEGEEEEGGQVGIWCGGFGRSRMMIMIIKRRKARAERVDRNALRFVGGVKRDESGTIAEQTEREEI
jgi:hypothetical protein